MSKYSTLRRAQKRSTLSQAELDAEDHEILESRYSDPEDFDYVPGSEFKPIKKTTKKKKYDQSQKNSGGQGTSSSWTRYPSFMNRAPQLGNSFDRPANFERGNASGVNSGPQNEHAFDTADNRGESIDSESTHEEPIEADDTVKLLQEQIAKSSDEPLRTSNETQLLGPDQDETAIILEALRHANSITPENQAEIVKQNGTETASPELLHADTISSPNSPKDFMDVCSPPVGPVRSETRTASPDHLHPLLSATENVNVHSPKEVDGERVTSVTPEEQRPADGVKKNDETPTTEHSAMDARSPKEVDEKRVTSVSSKERLPADVVEKTDQALTPEHSAQAFSSPDSSSKCDMDVRSPKEADGEQVTSVTSEKQRPADGVKKNDQAPTPEHSAMDARSPKVVDGERVTSITSEERLPAEVVEKTDQAPTPKHSAMNVRRPTEADGEQVTSVTSEKRLPADSVEKTDKPPTPEQSAMDARSPPKVDGKRVTSVSSEERLPADVVEKTYQAPTPEHSAMDVRSPPGIITEVDGKRVTSVSSEERLPADVVEKNNQAPTPEHSATDVRSPTADPARTVTDSDMDVHIPKEVGGRNFTPITFEEQHRPLGNTENAVQAPTILEHLVDRSVSFEERLPADGVKKTDQTPTPEHSAQAISSPDSSSKRDMDVSSPPEVVGGRNLKPDVTSVTSEKQHRPLGNMENAIQAPTILEHLVDRSSNNTSVLTPAEGDGEQKLLPKITPISSEQKRLPDMNVAQAPAIPEHFGLRPFTIPEHLADRSLTSEHFRSPAEVVGEQKTVTGKIPKTPRKPRTPTNKKKAAVPKRLATCSQSAAVGGQGPAPVSMTSVDHAFQAAVSQPPKTDFFSPEQSAEWDEVMSDVLRLTSKNRSIQPGTVQTTNQQPATPRTPKQKLFPDTVSSSSNATPPSQMNAPSPAETVAAPLNTAAANPATEQLQNASLDAQLKRIADFFASQTSNNLSAINALNLGNPTVPTATGLAPNMMRPISRNQDLGPSSSNAATSSTGTNNLAPWNVLQNLQPRVAELPFSVNSLLLNQLPPPRPISTANPLGQPAPVPIQPIQPPLNLNNIFPGLPTFAPPVLNNLPSTSTAVPPAAPVSVIRPVPNYPLLAQPPLQPVFSADFLGQLLMNGLANIQQTLPPNSPFMNLFQGTNPRPQ